MSKEKPIEYEIVSCTGDHLEWVRTHLSDKWVVMRKAGYDPTQVCGGCYDNSYRIVALDARSIPAGAEVKHVRRSKTRPD